MTPMGGRLLRQWILKPLRSLGPIRQRHEMIQQFLDQPFLLSAVREALTEIRDVERTLGRLSQGSGNARDVAALRVSLEALPDLKEHLRGLAKATLSQERGALSFEIADGIHELPELVACLRDALVEEPPAQIGRAS